MTEKLKVQDLPKEEQDKLIAEAQEYGIKGLVMAWNVETLKAKIEAAKEKQNGENDEQENAENEQNNGEDEQKADVDEPQKEEPKEEVKEEPAKEYKICHICRSKVIDGVCTGCGFALNK